MTIAQNMSPVRQYEVISSNLLERAPFECKKKDGEATSIYLFYNLVLNPHCKSCVSNPICFKRVSTFNLTKLERRKFSSLNPIALNPSLNSMTAVIKSTSGV